MFNKTPNSKDAVAKVDAPKTAEPIVTATTPAEAGKSAPEAAQPADKQADKK